MKKFFVIAFLSVSVFAFTWANGASAGEMEVVVDKLVEKGVLTPYEAQILIADAKAEAAQEMAQCKATTAPEWTQKIKMKGDVRFRTQTDWRKGLGPAHQRTRQRVRARLGVEGKVNEQVKAGVYIVTGDADPRSTNATLNDNFETKDLRVDRYYIKWFPQLPKEYGEARLDLGKFKNPFNKTELLWDSDISPAGMNIYWNSPAFDMGFGKTNVYTNAAMLWIEEEDVSQGDPIMWVAQGGLKSDVFPEWGGTFETSLSYYQITNTQNEWMFRNTQPQSGSRTNTTWTGPNNNEYRYAYRMIDLILEYDAKQTFDWELMGWPVGHGAYADLIWNTAAHGTGRDWGWILGAYLGTKKPKKPGQWKAWMSYRSLGRDAVPDYLPDSDFIGFRSNGNPTGGGTSGQGINIGGEYAVFKNTILAAEYGYYFPMDINGDADSMREPAQIMQLDVKVKF